jgi:hypothetical protein
MTASNHVQEPMDPGGKQTGCRNGDQPGGQYVSRNSPAHLAKTFGCPTPMIAELTTCEVLTGNPVTEAERMTIPEVNCVAKLWTGLIL